MKVFSKAYLVQLWKILVATFMGFINDNGLKLSASLAYYTVFSIAPLLIIIISLAGLVFHNDAASNAIYPHLVHYVGAQAATQVQAMLKNLALSGKSVTAAAVGICILMLGASSIFMEIQDSLNIIWRVKAKPKKGWLKLIQNRFLSFSLIIGVGFLLLASLIVNLIMTTLGDWLQHFMHSITTLLLRGINLGVTFIIISVLFGIIFKFLPDVKIKWRDVRSGAFFTAIFFMLGQYAINVYIQYTAKTSAYGAAGSILIVLVWIYYTSAILYIGADFTQVYAEAKGSQIEPAEYAVSVQQTEVLRDVKKLPPQNPELSGNLKEETDSAKSSV
jgi:membrane protein